MAVGAPLIYPVISYIDEAGVPLVGGQLFFFASGTNTPQNTFADGALTTPNANPLIADARGQFGPIFLDPTLGYKVKLEDANSVEQWVFDPITWTWITSQIAAAVAVETARAEAAEAAITAALAASDAAQSAVNTALSDAITAETVRAEAAEAVLQGEIDTINATLAGLPTSFSGTRGGQFDLSNPFDVTFSPAFPSQCGFLAGAYPGTGSPPIFYQPATLTNTGSTGTFVDNFGVPVGGVINWWAVGF